MDLTTNVIKNVYNIGSSACNAGTQYCTEGYALYFPCLKDITKGQDICFDFYIADSATRDVVDLRDVDAISLNLIGPFNCAYGTFSYPDNISSLQIEEHPVEYTISFDDRKLCHLDLLMVDTEGTGSEVYANSLDSDFFSGTEVEVAAYDTPTHIFIGWATLEDDEEECPDETIYDSIISKKNVYKFVINDNTILLALYRPRKVYSVISDPTNMFCHFDVNYDHIEYHISNRPDEVYDDGYNILESVLEGYHMVIKCIPSTDVLGDSTDKTFEFVKWKDNNTSRCRLLVVGKDTRSFEDGNVIKLKARCSGPVAYYELQDEDIYYEDEFDEDGIHINTIFSDVEILDYYGGENVIYTSDVYKKFVDEDIYLYINNGNLVLSSNGIEDGIKINIHAKTDDGCELTVGVNKQIQTQTISQDEFVQYEFYFSDCDNSNIEISTDGDCLIDRIEVCRETFIDKGKTQLCLNAETTSNLPSGKLSVNGAIMVKGKSYGLALTQVGEINKLPKITLNTDE